MTDLRPMWEKICRDLGINPGLVHAHFLENFEARWDPDYSWVGWGGVRWPDDGELPEVVVVFPYSEGKNGYYLDMMELRDTCYHELIHLLLREEIAEEEVTRMADILNRHQDGWRYWRSYLRGRAMALGLGPPDPAGMNLWQYVRLERKRRRRKRLAGRGTPCHYAKSVAKEEVKYVT